MNRSGREHQGQTGEAGEAGGRAFVGRMADPGVFALEPSRLWPLFGLWTIHVWIYWFNTLATRLESAAAPWWLGVYGVMTLVMLCSAIVHWSVPAEVAGEAGTAHRSDVPLTVVMAFVPVSVGLLALLSPGNVAWSSVNLVLAGVCVGWGYLRWAEVYARLGIRDAVGCLFASYVIGSAVKVVLDSAPGVVGIVVAVLIPVVSAVSLARVHAGEWPPCESWRGEVLYQKSGWRLFLRLGICVVVFCLVRQAISSAGMSGDGGGLNQLLGHVIEIGFALAALWYAFLLNRPLDFPQLWRFVFFFVATTVVAECLQLGSAIGAYLFDGVATSLIVMVLWLLLCDIAHHSDMHPQVIFGVGWSLYVGSNYAGAMLARAFGLDGMTASLGLVLVWVLGMAMVFCLGTRDSDVQRIFADMRKKVAPEEFATIDERCDELAEEYGLTARELDVMKMLAKGRSKSYIAEELYLSENTVRGHSRRLYAKLDVHTKAELQDLLGL